MESTTAMASSSSSLLNSALSVTQSPAFGAAGKAMAELGVAGCIGSACVQQQLISADQVRALSRTIFTILLPMFIGTGIMKTVSSQGGRLGRSSLAVPLLAASQAAILLWITSNLLIPLFGIDPDSDVGRTLSVTCSFGNAGVLPFIFAEALFRDNAKLLLQANSQVSLFSVGWSPFFWSFGKKILVGDVGGSKTGGNPLWQKLKVFLPPPVMGVLVGLVLSLSPLCPLLLSITPDVKAPLGVVYTSFQNLGKTASPLALLVLTCSLAMGAKKKVQQVTQTSASAPGPLRKWACVSTARFLLSPLVMLGLLYSMAKLGIIGSANTEPMLWFVVILESIMPPAQNSVVLLQVADRSEEASQMAKFLFSIYATAMIPLVSMITAALQTYGLVP